MCSFYRKLGEKIKKVYYRLRYNNELNRDFNHRRIDNIPIPKRSKEIRLFAILRNESLRLPYFISYYKNLGVDRFFFIDNNSSDSSSEIIKSFNYCHLYNTSASYKNHWVWMEYLLELYGTNHWCMVVDLDELFAWPNYEQLSLRDLITYLDLKNETAVKSILLDLYPKEAISKSIYKSGENPLELLRWFDTDFDNEFYRFFDRKNNKYFYAKTYTGGVRDRVFKGYMPNHLSKISFFRMDKDTYLTQGMHAINNSEISTLHGVTFHTKFLQDLPKEAEEESIREVHFGNAIVYKIMDSVLKIKPDLSFWDKSSVELKNSEQLVQIGLMHRPVEYIEYLASSTLKPIK